jgi:Tfp pilus assembly protein PilX
MKRVRSEDGFALVTSLVILSVMIGLGLGLLFLTDSQQKASSSEQNDESAFNVSEAALNSQIGQLARVWPAKPEESTTQPVACTSLSTTATNYCPGAASLTAGYPISSSLTCKAGATDPWGSPVTNEWTTYVRDDGPPTGPATTVYNSPAVSGYPRWDANGDGKVWVRSVGVVGCRMVTLISLAAEQLVPISFPQAAVSGNWFETSNEGNKTIINTQSPTTGEPGAVSMRCTGKSAAECENYREGQVSPDTTKVAASPSPTMTPTELEGQKLNAKSNGKYYKEGECPTTLAELTGETVYVEGPCNLSFTGGTGNSASSLGFLVIQNGTFTLDGNAEFYGTVYCVNKQESSGVLVKLQGTSVLIGAIIVDGNGGIVFGSSKENFLYNPLASKKVKSFAGASATRNSFRVLPINQ